MLHRSWKSIRRHPVAAVTVAAALLVTFMATFGWRTLRRTDLPGLVSEARRMMLQGEDRAALEQTDRALVLEPDDLDARLIRTRVFWHQGRWWDAVAEGRAVLRENPDNWEAHVFVAAAAKRGDLFSVAVDEHLAAVEERMPETADAHFLRGLIANFDGRHREAIAWLDQALELDPGHALALETRSDTHERLKEYAAAFADAERLATARPGDNTRAYQRKAHLYRQTHDEERALEAANRCIELDPELPDCYYQRAQVHWERGRTAEALADIARAIEVSPRPDPDWYELRADVYLAMSEYDRAIAESRRALELDPDCFGCYSLLSRAYWTAGEAAEARRVIEDLTERAKSWVDPTGLALAHTARARHFRRVGDYEQAVIEANRIVEIWPDRHWGYMWRAVARRRLEGASGVTADCDLMASLELDEPEDHVERAQALLLVCNRPDGAIEDCSAAIDLAPNWADAYHGRGRMHAREGRFEQALADYDRTVELTPSWIDAFTGRGRIHTSMGHYDRALADFQRAIEIGGAGGELRWELAQALDRLGRYEEAVRVLEDHAAANPGQEWVFRSIAYILFSHGRLDESLAALDRAVDAQPANPAHYAARGLISLFRPDLCERARSDLDRALELAPHSARVWALVAQGHVEGASRHCPGVYDPDRALELARRAVEQDSQSMFFQYVLGLAFYRHGLYEESRSALLRALELETDPGDEPFASFALAMVCAKLDRRAEARDHYDHGVARMRELHPESPRLTLLRGEAVELLGIRP